MEESPIPRANRRTVLVIEDDGDLRRLARRRLQAEGYAVHEARDGEEGWTGVLEHAPAALVMDVRMPKLDGIGLTRRVRADPRTCTVGIVLLSASVEQHDEAAGTSAGADVYLKKPCSRADLAGAVRRAIEAGTSRSSVAP